MSRGPSKASAAATMSMKSLPTTCPVRSGITRIITAPHSCRFRVAHSA
jgi:hypothetical protein